MLQAKISAYDTRVHVHFAIIMVHSVIVTTPVIQDETVFFFAGG